MLQVTQTNSISQISKDMETHLKYVVDPKSLLTAQKLGELAKLDQILETLFFLGVSYDLESFVHEGKVISKSEYKVPSSFMDLANANVLWLLDNSVTSQPIIKSAGQYEIKLLPSEVEYFFHVLGVKVETFKAERFSLFNFNQIRLGESGLSAVLGGTKDGSILEVLGMSLSEDGRFFETGIQTSKEEIRLWLKQQTELRK